MASQGGLEAKSSALDRMTPGFSVLLGLLRTVGRATALAFARVFAVATVVSRLAAALTLAGVLALASMLFLDLLVVLLVLVLPLILGAKGSLQRRKQSRSVNCRSGSGDQSCECRTREHSLCGFRHYQTLLSILGTSPRNTVTTTFTPEFPAPNESREPRKSFYRLQHELDSKRWHGWPCG